MNNKEPWEGSGITIWDLLCFIVGVLFLVWVVSTLVGGAMR